VQPHEAEVEAAGLVAALAGELKERRRARKLAVDAAPDGEEHPEATATLPLPAVAGDAIERHCALEVLIGLQEPCRLGDTGVGVSATSLSGRLLSEGQ